RTFDPTDASVRSRSSPRKIQRTCMCALGAATTRPPSSSTHARLFRNPTSQEIRHSGKFGYRFRKPAARRWARPSRSHFKMQFPLEWKKAVGFCDGIHNYPSRTEEGFRQLVQETHACWNAVDRLAEKDVGRGERSRREQGPKYRAGCGPG